MKKLILIVALMNGGVAFGYSEPGAASAGASASTPDEEQQQIVVEAWRRDRALDAFLSGDFATAEVEFRKNKACIRRVALQQEAAFREGLVEADRSSMRGAAADPGIHHLPQNPDQIRERTCHNKEWQIYMIGLSQIQLGQFAEAKKSLYSVMSLTKEDVFFDAHYRVALLELMDGNVEKANRRLAHLVDVQRRCDAKGARCVLHGDLDEATSYLAHAVASAQRERSR
jgi:hypothetical protein